MQRKPWPKIWPGIERCYTTSDKRDYINYLKWLLIISLLLPIKVTAQTHEKEIVYIPQTALSRPSEEVITKLAQDYEAAQAKLRVAKSSSKNYGSNYGGSCVAFAKKYLGVYGTWGNGGHRLSLNSGPRVGAVVIFKGTHVAVIQAINGQSLTIIESNYDYKGHIRTRTLSALSTSIKGYHLF